ncbi:Flgd [Buchnera aphidicola str. G002 (Myzus persicae)]|uniref:Basal-body rod modification protein FlgD n=2 Tax=Buchnera aphidicola TaxID=9 RepID=W0P4P7_BUCMP|nr:flagellar hook capping FlgD N-terminal domain-containing protein [Buchnera aphidicola]AHG60048.1 Flgd [Buchnera aphidicola str. USDA (Myzus persicae)]AHG60628.1 Flgd [Buchnera aphidicola str. W106 (Myzus persicae)]AHG61200.1 Flgd [Buchnera aphidicola str. G002 (Myzus persicae)]AHG61773.1 Flgd [Buchnera aphidicola str. F009 (Myzus persicae)]WAI03267.1 MAG: flagellar biosynthesis protein FlgD [Buchnera aphidicola (Myzus persicae)]
MINMNSSIDNKLIEKNINDSPNNLNPLDLQKNFLSLLIAQIKNQDPTDPIKNTELTSQLAQINTATGVEKLNNTVLNISNEINKNQNVQISSLIGHRVMIPSTQIVHTQGAPSRYGIELVGYATLVEIQIKDKNGNTLYTKRMNDMKPGIHNFIWNAKDINTGKYDILVSAKNKDQNIPVQSLSESLVQSVIISSRGPLIDLGVAGNITLSQIREILK